MELLDAVVIGAGPAGSAAATVLARAGHSVVIVDKASFPRDKCCGDGLTTLALRELDALGFELGQVEALHEVADVVLRSPSGREVHLELPPGGVAAATAPRRQLDHALLRHAVAAGATSIDGVAVAGVEVVADGVAVQLDDGRTLRAAHVVAADGMWSPTRKLLGIAAEGYRGEWHAFRQYAANVTGPAATDLIVWFEPDLLPGYAWSFPLPGGRANIGFGVLRDGQRRVQDMAALWPDLLGRAHIVAALGEGFELEDRHTAWPIPCAITDAVLHHGPVLFVGDAARAGDVMTGEGIGQALATGRLAAEAIRGAHRGPGCSCWRAGATRPTTCAAGVGYAAEVRRELFADHRMSAVLNRLLAKPLAARGAIRLVGTSGWTRRNFARWMFEDEGRASLLTPRRWHRQFLRRPMPYATHDRL